MAIISDNAIDHEIHKIKSFIEKLKIAQATFSNTFQTMLPKERARMITQIQSDHKAITAFIEKSKKTEVNNSGTKFALENIKQSFQTLMTLWRKTEKNLENFTAGSAPKTISASSGGGNETQRAVEKYTAALRDLGHTPDESSIHTFREKLESAYQRAKSQSGGKELSIEIVKEGSKIKVRMGTK